MQTRPLSHSEEFSLLLVKRGVKEMSREELEDAVIDLWEALMRTNHLMKHEVSDNSNRENNANHQHQE
jgi:hypothetical protein